VLEQLLDGLREAHHRDRLGHIGLRARGANSLLVAARGISGTAMIGTSASWSSARISG
jgi:hypothetical protein